MKTTGWCLFLIGAIFIIEFFLYFIGVNSLSINNDLSQAASQVENIITIIKWLAAFQVFLLFVASGALSLASKDIKKEFELIKEEIKKLKGN